MIYMTFTPVVTMTIIVTVATVTYWSVTVITGTLYGEACRHSRVASGRFTTLEIQHTLDSLLNKIRCYRIFYNKNINSDMTDGGISGLVV